MNLSKFQIGTIAVIAVLFLTLFFLGRTKPKVKKGENTAEEPKQTLNIESVLANARNELDSIQLTWLTDLDKEKAQASSIQEEAEVLKLISRTWNEYGNFIAGGYYAEKVAELLVDGTSWSVAGTTYGIAFNKNKAQDQKQLAVSLAIKAFEKAMALEPDTLRHAINEALMYLDLSTVDAKVMPMQGVLKLKALDKKFPNNVLVNMTLGRLSATRSGDMAKAKPRFEKVLAIAESKPVEKNILLEANFFLVECYKAENNKEKILYHYEKCIELSADNSKMQQEMIKAKQHYIENN